MKKLYWAIISVLGFALACSEDVIFDLEENLEIEQAHIDDFLQRNSIDTEVTDKGFRFRLLSSGTGPVGEEGQTVHLNFEMYLLDSTLLNTNIASVIETNPNFQPRLTSPHLFRVFERSPNFAEPQFIEFAVANLAEGGVIDLFVPSAFGFGDTNIGFRHLLANNIPANTPILARIIVVEVSDN